MQNGAKQREYSLDFIKILATVFIVFVDLIEISTLSEKHSGNIQLINNSDKGSGNTLQLSSQATG